MKRIRFFLGFMVLASLIFLGLSRFSHAQDNSANADLSVKLDKIAEKQERILQEIQSLRGDLSIVRTRI